MQKKHIALRGFSRRRCDPCGEKKRETCRKGAQPERRCAAEVKDHTNHHATPQHTPPPGAKVTRKARLQGDVY